MLRNRIGKASLVTVRERCGGLLVLLERHPRLFRVDRIPKNDCVSLVPTTPAMVAQLLSSAASDKGGASSGSGNTAEDAVDGAGDAAGAFGGGDAASASQPPGSPGGADHGMSTRCLHVGNVASNMTEANLRAKFGKYGPIEALKCVPALCVCMCLYSPAQPLTFAPLRRLVSSRKGRRFAFVTFEKSEHAERARAALTKQNIWRSNISFAKVRWCALPAVVAGYADLCARIGQRETVAWSQHRGMAKSGSTNTEADRPPASDGKASAAAMAAAAAGRNLQPSRHLWVGCLYNTSKKDIETRFTRFGRIDNINYLKERHCAFVDFVNRDSAMAAFKAMQNARIGDQVIELGFGRAWASDKDGGNKAAGSAAGFGGAGGGSGGSAGRRATTSSSSAKLRAAGKARPGAGHSSIIPAQPTRSWSSVVKSSQPKKAQPAAVRCVCGCVCVWLCVVVCVCVCVCAGAGRDEAGRAQEKQEPHT